MLPMIIAILIIVALGLIGLIYILFWGTPPIINWAVERLGLRMMLTDPETLTTLGLLDNTLLDFHSGSLTDASPHYMAALRQLDRDGLALMRRYDPANLAGQKLVTYELMTWYFEQNLRGHRFDYHWVTNPVFMGPYPVNHVFGVQVDLINFLSTYHKIKGKRSVRRYLQRLEMVEEKISGLLESLEARASGGALPPRFVIKKCLVQIADFLSHSPDENVLYTSFITRANEAGILSESAITSWGEKIQGVIEKVVFPAYSGLQSVLQEYELQASEEDGVWKLPDGTAYYNFLLRNHTTTDMTADEIHQLGLEEVERLSNLISEGLEGLGLPIEEPGRQLQSLMEDPQYHFSGENQRQAIMDEYQAVLDEVNLHMPQIFTHGSLDAIEVQRLPLYKEPDSPIAYAQAPAMDGSRPGMMWINLRNPENVYRWGMRTLAYHEGIPGHVYQMAHAQKIKGLPTFRRTYFFNAYIEGWALYAERLGWELGLEDDLSNLGRLQALIWRAARLVVDTGIHAERWTRQEAIDYMVEKTGLPIRDVTTEVERYIVMPGQACAYYIGYLKLRSLRQKAEAVLGDAFDLKIFHDVIINNGGLPMNLLQSVVDEYIDRKAGLKSKLLE